jgi:hypothetical protein
MDFIEKWLHVSPDGGSGTTEVLWLVAVAAVVAVAGGLAIRRSRRRRP